MTIRDEAPDEPPKGDKELRDYFIKVLGGQESIGKRVSSREAGMDYVQKNRKNLYEQYRGQWIAANAEGVVAFAGELLQLKEKVAEMIGGNPHPQLATGAVYFEFCGTNVE